MTDKINLVGNPILPSDKFNIKIVGKIDLDALNKPKEPTNNTLVRTPSQDTFVPSVESVIEATPPTTMVNSDVVIAKPMPVVQKDKDKAKVDASLQTTAKQLLLDYEKIKEEAFLSDELMLLLQPKVSATGNKTFTKNQAKMINLAVKRMHLYRGIAKNLEREGTEALPTVMRELRGVFGGESNYGKYLYSRMKNGVPVCKDSHSIYNKLVKEFNAEKINGEFMNIFAKRYFQKSYKQLDKTEKNIIKMYIEDGSIKLDSREYKVLEKLLATSKNDVKQAKDWVRDLIGVRLIIPEGQSAKKAAEYLTEALQTGKIKVTRVSNYHTNYISPYIKHETIKLWTQSVPGIEVLQSSSAKKRNGYTTTQMNMVFDYKDKHNKDKTVFVELQIRSEALNQIGQREHLIYDILANKNISKGIPELQAYYDSIGIVAAVKDVFKNPEKESKYLDYERAVYSWIRNNEKNLIKGVTPIIYDKPILTDFGLVEYENLLSFDALKTIDDKANIIKAKYGNKLSEKNS